MNLPITNSPQLLLELLVVVACHFRNWLAPHVFVAASPRIFVIEYVLCREVLEHALAIHAFDDLDLVCLFVENCVYI
jgi:hypothetical protein